MNANQQLKKLTDELQQVLEEKECLREKYENILESHKNVLKQCRCSCKGDFRNDTLENAIKLKNMELEAMVNSLRTQVTLLEIQLNTYKEDFLMERKDREAAQDRVIRLEQELADLCSGGCIGRCSESTIEVPRGKVNSQGFEVLPSSADFSYPNPIPLESDSEAREPLSSRRESRNVDIETSKGLKSVISCIVKKKSKKVCEEKEFPSTAKDATWSEFKYEFDGIKPLRDGDTQLRGRMFQKMSPDNESFIIIPNLQQGEEFKELSHSKDINLSKSQTTSIISVLPQSSNFDFSQKSPKRSSNNIIPLEQQLPPEKGGLDSDEILRCPACFQAFKASTEHYQLLQHMDSCGVRI